jgi:hypothetical protein
MGMQFFANRFKFDDGGYSIPVGGDDEYEWRLTDSERANFDDFHNSFITIFQVLSGENWNTVMYDGWRATSVFAVVYFVSLVVLGMFIVMTLFLAILLNNFNGDDDDEEEEEDDEMAKEALDTINKMKASGSAKVVPKVVPLLKGDTLVGSYETDGNGLSDTEKAATKMAAPKHETRMTLSLDHHDQVKAKGKKGKAKSEEGGKFVLEGK